MERRVVHLNVAHFMASVEELCDRSLRGRPFLIAPAGRSRAVAIDVSEKAFHEGVRRGMAVDEAARRVRGMPVLPPRFDLYARAERGMREIVCRYSPLVEEAGTGHLYTDISGTGLLFGEPVDLAARMRQEISERLGFSPIAGLAVNKLVSKVATRVVKPVGFIAVQPGDERGFLARQEVGLLPGIGKKLTERMGLLGIREIGDLAELSDADAAAALGRGGTLLRSRARGIDATPVTGEPASRRRIRAEALFDTDTRDAATLEGRLFALVEELGLRLRESGMAARTVELLIVYTDAGRALAQAALPRASSYDRDLFETARALLSRHLSRRVRVRKIAAALSGLQPRNGQLDLFTPPERLKLESLQHAVDRIRGRYGRDAIRAGRTLAAP